uniref:PH domain-containing protein n=1 Tax=Vannella robusta TaxID=1487602 RepID=A0A7S4HZW2_9EUKA
MPKTILVGQLEKRAPSGPVRKWKKRCFCLKDDLILRYFEGETLKGTIDLRDILTCEGETNSPNFQIVTAKRIFELRAKNAEDKDYWITGINKLLNTSKE